MPSLIPLMRMNVREWTSGRQGPPLKFWSLWSETLSFGMNSRWPSPTAKPGRSWEGDSEKHTSTRYGTARLRAR
jgi:hypothetical protein